MDAINKEAIIFENNILETIKFNRVSIDEKVKTNSSFSVSVSEDDKRRIKLISNVSVCGKKKKFLELTFVSFFKSDVIIEKEEEIETDEIAVFMINQVLPEISKMASDIMKKSYGHELELPKKINKGDLQSEE